MQLSAEIRWFWRSVLPAGLEDWFCTAEHHPFPAGGGQTRRDEYLRDCGDMELGIKRRDGKGGLEIKGIVGASSSPISVGPFQGSTQIWGKWSSTSLGLDESSTISVDKLRWLRKFETATREPVEIALDADEQPLESNNHHASRSCCVELTRATVLDEDVWWTLGFEAVGSLRTVEEDLLKVVRVMSDRWQGARIDGLLASYPVWLKEHALESLMAHV